MIEHLYQEFSQELLAWYRNMTGKGELAEEGVTVKNCARLNIKEDVSPEMILEKLQIVNCASVQCSPEQKSAVQMVGEHIANISDGETQGEARGILGTLKNLAESKMINGEKYSL